MGGTPNPLPVPNPGPTAATPGPHPGPEPGPSGLGVELPDGPLFGKTAVFEAMPQNGAVKALSDLATDAKFDRKELTITVAKENIIAACNAVIRKAQKIMIRQGVAGSAPRARRAISAPAV